MLECTFNCIFFFIYFHHMTHVLRSLYTSKPPARFLRPLPFFFLLSGQSWENISNRFSDRRKKSLSSERKATALPNPKTSKTLLLSTGGRGASGEKQYFICTYLYHVMYRPCFLRKFVSAVGSGSTAQLIYVNQRLTAHSPVHKLSRLHA